jgi:hypothetical protein
MVVVDLALTDRFNDLWKKTLLEITQGNDKLKDNYVNLDPKNFLSFTVLIEHQEIICFSALQSAIDRWGLDIARCSTRMWVHPNYRFSGMTKFTQGKKFLNSFYLIPQQLRTANELGYKCVFMSREENPKAFNEWTNLVNRNSSGNFQNLTNRYNVCGSLDPIPESCKQYISINLSNPYALDIWNLNMEKFKIKEDSILGSRVY